MSEKNKAFSDYILDRKFLKRKLSIWRNIALVLLAMLLVNYISKKYPASPKASNYIAKITIKGEIFGDNNRDEALKDIAKNKKIKAVIVNINSGGGGLYSGEKTYNLIKKIAKQKPVVAVIEAYGASGAYMTAMGADYIIAGNTSIVGSIGAVSLSPDISELSKKVGVKFNVIKSGSLKAQPQPFEKMSPEARVNLQNMIDESYQIFLSMLLKERNIPQNYLKEISTGAAFFGKDSIKMGLVDKIGDEDDALEYLQKDKKLPKSLKVKEVHLHKKKHPYQAIFDIFEDVQQSTHKIHLFLSKLFTFSII